jgi:hypothetical protein
MKTNVHFFTISRSVLFRMIIFLGKNCRENEIRHFVFNIFFFSRKSCRLCGKILQTGAGHRWQYGACTLHAGYLRLQTHALTICNIYCFSTAAVVARTRLDIMLPLILPVLFNIEQYVFLPVTEVTSTVRTFRSWVWNRLLMEAIPMCYELIK